MPRSSGDVPGAGEAQEIERDVAEARHGLRPGALAHLGAVFVVRDVAHVVQLVLNAPVLAVEVEELGAIGASGRKAGDAEVDLLAVFPRSVTLLDLDLGLDPKDLPRVGKLDVLAPADPAVSPDLARLEPPVSARGRDVRRGKKTPSPCSQCRRADRVGCP